MTSLRPNQGLMARVFHRRGSPTTRLAGHPGEHVTKGPFDQPRKCATRDPAVTAGPGVRTGTPAVAWAQSLNPGAESFGYLGAFRPADGNPAAALAAVAHGFVPVSQLIEKGDILFRNPQLSYGTSDEERDPMFDSHTARDLLYEVYGSEASIALFDSDSPSQLANHYFPNSDIKAAASLLGDAVSLEDFSSQSGATAAPTVELDPFYSLRAGISRGGFTLAIPRLELNLADVIRVRGGEEAFQLFRDALSTTLLATGDSRMGESTAEYAARIRIAASENFVPFEEELERVKSRGSLYGLIPGAAGMVVNLAVGLATATVPGFGAPGASMVTKAGLRKLFRPYVKDGDAANVALRYATNLRLAGRL